MIEARPSFSSPPLRPPPPACGVTEETLYEEILTASLSLQRAVDVVWRVKMLPNRVRSGSDGGSCTPAPRAQGAPSPLVPALALRL